MAGNLLSWAIVLLAIALGAAGLGFSGLAGTASGLALNLFFVSLVLSVVLFVMNVARGRSPL